MMTLYEVIENALHTADDLEAAGPPNTYADRAGIIEQKILKQWPWIEWFIEWSTIVHKPQQEKQA